MFWKIDTASFVGIQKQQNEYLQHIKFFIISMSTRSKQYTPIYTTHYQKKTTQSNRHLHLTYQWNWLALHRTAFNFVFVEENEATFTIQCDRFPLMNASCMCTTQIFLFYSATLHNQLSNDKYKLTLAWITSASFGSE